MKRVILLCLGLAGLSIPAHADKQAYCQAYARDFADGIAKDKAGWDHKFQIAMESCMGPKVEVPMPKVKSVAVAQPPAAAPPVPEKAKDKTAEKSKVDAKTDTATADKPAADNKLAPGSEAWNGYCAKKYASFDAKTGMYKSMKGIARPCLVTKDVKG